MNLATSSRNVDQKDGAAEGNKEKSTNPDETLNEEESADTDGTSEETSSESDLDAEPNWGKRRRVKTTTYYRKKTFLALRETNERFYICQLLQDYNNRNEKKFIKLKWLEELQKSSVYKFGNNDCIQLENTILVEVKLESVDLGCYHLPKDQLDIVISALNASIKLQRHRSRLDPNSSEQEGQGSQLDPNSKTNTTSGPLPPNPLPPPPPPSPASNPLTPIAVNERRKILNRDTLSSNGLEEKTHFSADTSKLPDDIKETNDSAEAVNQNREEIEVQDELNSIWGEFGLQEGLPELELLFGDEFMKNVSEVDEESGLENAFEMDVQQFLNELKSSRITKATEASTSQHKWMDSRRDPEAITDCYMCRNILHARALNCRKIERPESVFDCILFFTNPEIEIPQGFIDTYDECLNNLEVDKGHGPLQEFNDITDICSHMSNMMSKYEKKDRHIQG